MDYINRASSTGKINKHVTFHDLCELFWSARVKNILIPDAVHFVQEVMEEREVYRKRYLSIGLQLAKGCTIAKLV